MDASNPITAAVFSAFIKCPTKAHLLAIGEHAPGAYFADIEARIASLYKAAAKRGLQLGAEVAEPLNFGDCERSPVAQGHRGDRGDLAESGGGPAYFEKTLRRLRLSAEVSRPRHRT